ncbi:PAS domain S-box protein [Teichococcus aestuarii]|uniref:PAS domain S-box protein n=1 Tax=Teichococcus aestuarii TaxID=568898 RepID=UPI003607299C
MPDHLLQRKAEIALGESEERYRTLSDAAREGVAIHHLGRIVDANAAFWRMFGYASLQEVIGRETLDFVAPEFREDALRSASCGNGRPHRGRGLRADGSTFSAEFQGSPVAYRRQRMQVLIVRDCTAEEKARQSLRESERNLRLTLETLDLGAFMSRTPEGVITYWSAGCERVFGWRASEAVGYPLHELLRTVFPVPVSQIQQALLASGEWSGELVQHTRSGEARSIAVRKTLRRGSDGVPLVVMESVVDVTPQRRAETALRERSRRLALLSEAAANLLGAGDPEQVLRGLFATLSADLGVDAVFSYLPEAQAWRLAAGIGPDPGQVAAFSLLPFGPAICDAVARSRAPVHWTAQPDPAAPQEQAAAPPGIQAYVCFPLLAGEDVLGALAFASHARERFQEEDVAFLATIAQHVAVVRRRLRADEELRKAERRSRALLEAAPVSIALLEPGSLRVLRANQRACLELGYSMAEFTTLRIADLEMAGTAGHSLAIAATQLGAKGDEIRTRFRNRAGDRLDMLVRVEPVEIDGENLVYASWTNVTELSRIRWALEESEGQLRSILATVPDAMVVIDESGRIVSFSTTAERLFGWQAVEVLGQEVSVLMPEPDRSRHAGYLSHYLRTGERRIIGIGRRVHGQRRDGSVFPMELTVGEVRTKEGHLFTGFLRDLSQDEASQRRLNDLQTELLHVSRLSVAGEMASALAHELNQPLTAIASSTRAALRLLEASPGHAVLPPRVLEALQRAASQSLRAGQIVQRLRDFVMKGEVEREPVLLRDIIGEARELALLGVAHHGVEISIQLDQDLPPVLVDRVQIQQVVLNLIRNAVEAMSEAGGQPCRLTINATRRGAGMLEVAVRDTGPGLSPAVEARLFEPFVTTKRGGMGVGLSICRSIVEAHDGRLWSEPNPGGGAVFRFTLPLLVPSDARLLQEEKP